MDYTWYEIWYDDMFITFVNSKDKADEYAEAGFTVKDFTK